MTEVNMVIEFPPFKLDLRAERLLRGSEAVDLRPKMWSLLRYMAERPEQLLSKDELLDAVWGDVVVTASSLNQAVLELRRILGDDSRDPRFIETVHRRGFRFIASIAQAQVQDAERPAPAPSGARPLFGRDPELNLLGSILDETTTGQRQVVFITGEPGIGKSSLLEGFLEHLTNSGESVFVGGGQCVETLGESEAYLPILDALDRMARGPGSETRREALSRFAPTWLAQLPWLIDEEADGPVPLVGTPARMLREFAIATEYLAREQPTILWLEDMHWSDPATVDLLNTVAQRREMAPLLILATYRPAEAALHEHPIAPLKRSLVQKGQAREIKLDLLDIRAVESFLADRFPGLEETSRISELVHEHTDGNPLFIETVSNHMQDNGWIAEEAGAWHLARPLETIHAELPDSLHAIVETHLDSLTDDEVAVLEAGSATGDSFAAQHVATALDLETDAAESICKRLAGWGHLLNPLPVVRWPDGSEGQRFNFKHHVFQNVIYKRTPPAKRQRLHLRLAHGMETAHPELRGVDAAGLALHFERGGDTTRAIHYLEMAADGVRRRLANRESVSYLERALELLLTQPDSEERAHQEVAHRHRLVRALIQSAGDTSKKQQKNLASTLELGRKLGEPRYQLISLAFQSSSGNRTGQLNRVRELVEESRTLAAQVDDPVLKNHFRSVAGVEAALRGEHQRSFEENSACLDALDGIDPVSFAEVSPVDFTLFSLIFMGWSAWLTGRPDEARRWGRTALERAYDSRTGPFGVVVALPMVSIIEVFRRDRQAVDEHRKTVVALLGELGIPWPYTHLSITKGWLLVQAGEIDGAIQRLRKGVALASNFGVFQGMSLLQATLAEAELAQGSTPEANQALDEATGFIERTGERFWEAEIHRLRGECARADGDLLTAEEHFRASLGVARRQGALSLELRTATSLAKLLSDTDRTNEARSLLRGTYNQFEEGFETADLVDAKALLDELQGRG